MDFKTTYLKKPLGEQENLLPEMEGLNFATVSEDMLAFDSTHYIEVHKLTPIDYKVFMRTMKSLIETLAKQYERSTSELFYVTPDNHVWIASELAFVWLAFINPEMLIYFNNLVGDALTDGVAYSDGFIYDATLKRMPSDILQEIIKRREANNGGEESKQQ